MADEVGHARVFVRQLVQPRLLLEGVAERAVEPLPRSGHELGDGVGLGEGQSHGAAHVTDGGLGLEGPEGGDLGDLVGAVLLLDVPDHLVAAADAEVHVDVRHGAPFRVQETLEQQVVPDRVEVGDAQGVGHQAAGRRAASRTHRDALVLGVVDEVRDDEEVTGELHALDDVQLVVEPCPVGVAVDLAGVLEAVLEPLAGARVQVVVKALGVGGLVVREVVLAELDFHVTAFRDGHALVHGVGQVCESRPASGSVDLRKSSWVSIFIRLGSLWPLPVWMQSKMSWAWASSGSR